jgi:hypothetical protein
MQIKDGDLVTYLASNEQTFVFVYRDETKTKLLRHLGSMAANPELKFSWSDAAEVANRIRLGSCMCGLCVRECEGI